MKIILSRKGFDKENGGVASPIFPDNGLCSLPIPSPWLQRHPPEPRYRVSYQDLSYVGQDLGSVVEDLTLNRRTGKPRVRRTDLCHLDPDLIRGDLVRKRGWLPMFGQGNAAAAHLLNHGVREGDLFLFFGWFRKIEEEKERNKFDPAQPNVHVIFGWLQIGDIWCEFRNQSVLPKWAKCNAHVRGDVNGFSHLGEPEDVIFIAKRRLEVPGIRRRLPGGGVFTEYHPDLQLTEPGKSRGHWKLPFWMYPTSGRKPLTYHPERRIWKKGEACCYLEAADIGQEFVLDCDCGYPVSSTQSWLARLFSHAD